MPIVLRCSSQIGFPQPDQIMFFFIRLDSCDQQMMTWQSFRCFRFVILLLDGVSSKAISPKDWMDDAGGEQGVTTAAHVLAHVVVVGTSNTILVSSVEVILLPSLATLSSSLSSSLLATVLLHESKFQVQPPSTSIHPACLPGSTCKLPNFQKKFGCIGCRAFSDVLWFLIVMTTAC